MTRLRALNENHRRILAALRRSLEDLGATEDLVVVGSLSGHILGRKDKVGDIDVLMESRLCARYWEFAEHLMSHGLKSAFDILDKPSTFRWECCVPTLAHGLAFTSHPELWRRWWTGREPLRKDTNLDICVRAADLNHIPDPGARRWVYLLDPRAVSESAITENRKTFVENLKDKEGAIQKSTKVHAELGLYYDMNTATTAR